MSTRSTSRRIRRAVALPPVAAHDPVRPRSGLSLARHIIAHEIRLADAAIFAAALIAPIAALAVLL